MSYTLLMRERVSLIIGNFHLHIGSLDNTLTHPLIDISNLEIDRYPTVASRDYN